MANVCLFPGSNVNGIFTEKNGKKRDVVKIGDDLFVGAQLGRKTKKTLRRLMRNLGIKYGSVHC